MLLEEGEVKGFDEVRYLWVFFDDVREEFAVVPAQGAVFADFESGEGYVAVACEVAYIPCYMVKVWPDVFEVYGALRYLIGVVAEGSRSGHAHGVDEEVL